MALRLSSDLIADVARAAQPERARMASARLREGGAAGAMFAEALSASVAPQAAPSLAGLRERLAAPTAMAAPPRASAAARGLETMLMKTLVDGVAPRKSVVFGKGAAGESWRMLLTDSIATRMADSGRVGLARGLIGGGLAAALRGPGRAL